MSYGSTFVPFDPHGKISARHTRARQDISERPTRVLQYEKQFDVNLSRIDGPPTEEAPSKSSIRDSMLAYSKKMRSLHDARHGPGGNSGDKLFVRAKHIPKYPTKEPKKRRPMSFDELLGRDREAGETRSQGAKQRPSSDKTKPVRDSGKRTETEVRLPLLTERLKKAGPIHVSVVSASDLYDIVDFSLKQKGTKSDSLKLMRMERETQEFGRVHTNKMADERHPPEDAYNKYERTTDNYQQDYLRRDRYAFYNDNDSSIPDSAFYEQTFAIDRSVDVSPRQETNMNSNLKLPALTLNDPIRKRPNRAKRMRLVDPMLGDIPEDKIFSTGRNPYELDYHSRRVISPPPKFQTSHAAEPKRRSLDSIEESIENGQSIKNKREYDTSDLDTCQMKHDYVTDDGTPRDYRSVFPVADPKSTKKILIRDDGDVRIEVTQCPPKHATLNTKQKAQKRFKKLIYLRDGAR